MDFVILSLSLYIYITFLPLPHNEVEDGYVESSCPSVSVLVLVDFAWIISFEPHNNICNQLNVTVSVLYHELEWYSKRPEGRSEV